MGIRVLESPEVPQNTYKRFSIRQNKKKNFDRSVSETILKIDKKQHVIEAERNK